MKSGTAKINGGKNGKEVSLSEIQFIISGQMNQVPFKQGNLHKNITRLDSEKLTGTRRPGNLEKKDG